MLPLSVTEQLASVGTQIGMEQSTLATFLETASAVAAPGAPGPHLPGMLLDAGFKFMEAGFFGLVQGGIVNAMQGGAAVVTADITYHATDAAGGGAVGSAGAGVAGAFPR